LYAVIKRAHHGKKFLVDSVASAIFWTLVYIPVFVYTSKSIELALVGVASAALIEILFGGVYGRFLDWFRTAFDIKTTQSATPSNV
jgi:hypothetical protein